MDWSEIVDNPYLQDLPFKIEQDRYGNILMSPASNWHGRVQFRVAKRLERELSGGEAFVECSVRTSEGVKVPDVVWQSEGHFSDHGNVTPMPVAPEICIEGLSPWNSRAEMDEKRRLYFEAGALEVWVCDNDGKLEFFGPEGQRELSQLAPGFPRSIE
jgi:Uma2 family endonuclease